MTTDSAERVRAGWRAIEAGRWQAAREAFDQALVIAESPEARDGLGIARWWLNEIRESHEQRTRAYLGYRRNGNRGQAARLAIWLGREQVFYDGYPSAMLGWFARAETLLAGVSDHDRAWCRLFTASMIAPPAELAEAATEAIGVARQTDDASLECIGLAFRGAALVALNEVSDGLASLDEAMTMVVSGEVRDLQVISEVFCVLIDACSTAGDLDRFAQWCRQAEAFAERTGSVYLGAYCRASYGSVLVQMGHWESAERQHSSEHTALLAGPHRAWPPN